MSPRTGRPKSEKPKQTQLGVRLDDEQLEQLDVVSSHYKETRAESIRRGIQKLYSDLKK
jgi:predicted DNA-binding protein